MKGNSGLNTIKMAKTNKTKQIENSIEKSLANNEIFINEFTVKGDKFNLIYDGITYDTKSQQIIGYEVKVSVSDFNNLYRKLLHREHNYDIYVDKFYICVPEDMEEFAKDKLNEWNNDIAYIKEIGLKVFNDNTQQLRNKRSAKQNTRVLFNVYIKDNMVQNICNKWIEKNRKKIHNERK